MILFKQTDKTLWALALPMILSNISVSLLGIIDTAVIGHLGNEKYLGGVAIGTSVTSFIFMLLLFLRMGTTGITAQAFAIFDKNALSSAFVQPMCLAIVIGIIIIIMRDFLTNGVLNIVGGDQQVLKQACLFMRIRWLGAPANLANLVIVGWLFGMQYIRVPVIILFIGNVINIILNLWFIKSLHWNVIGSASATVITDYIVLLLSSCLVWHIIKMYDLKLINCYNIWHTNIYQLLVFHRDIILRSLLLQLCLVSITILGARIGYKVVAINTVLMNFMTFTSYFLDGFAYAIEIYSGYAYGARNIYQLQSIWHASYRQAIYLATFLTLFYTLFGKYIIKLLTSLPDIQVLAMDYLPWQIILPFFGVWCYLFDGIFIGATRGKDMRNSMAISVLGYSVTLCTLPYLGNHGLWLSITVFLLLRGMSLWILWQRHQQNNTWF
ncbi:MATE family efflux transporter DinF [Candidatus Profftia lariciata]|uniref:MATE family efflux transporter DinF n=1 Tax=Candidatus Profftia lariciata TaxID=1987921 RepID=UPI001D014F34|nr:MATE family efflux transporter DinF [Candidatus Profftia lariciata]